MNPNTTHKKQSSHEMKRDWAELFSIVCTGRKLILKGCGIGAVMGLIIALGTPKEYTASTLVAHEGTRRRSYSDISALADMTGDMNTSVATERDALYPSLYSSIVNSTPFLLQLYDIRVNMQKGSTTMTLTQYLKRHQKTPWWNIITSAPSNLVVWCLSLFKEKPKLEKVEKVEKVERKKESVPFRLNREEVGIAGIIASCINIKIDKKKRTIAIDVTMQDPQVAATVADTVQTLLKEYMTEYRISKARRVLEYNEMLCKEAQAEYYTSQDRYTRFVDANQNLAMLTSRSELIGLQNEMKLALTIYNQMEMQVQAAKARVDKVTPVYTVIQPVTVPLSPSKPRMVLILAGCILLSAAGSIGWILFVKDFIKRIKREWHLRAVKSE